MIDANNDGDISITEAEKVEYIHFVGDINNKEELKGIEFFNKQKQLSIRYITNTTIDVSKNTELESLGCNDNRLTTLDVSKNTKLSYLRCLPMCDITGRNLLTTIYMSNNQVIQYFYKPEATVVEYK